MHLLREYAWLLGDGALLLWVIYELVSVMPRNKEVRKDDEDHPPGDAP